MNLEDTQIFIESRRPDKPMGKLFFGSPSRWLRLIKAIYFRQKALKALSHLTIRNYRVKGGAEEVAYLRTILRVDHPHRETSLHP